MQGAAPRRPGCSLNSARQSGGPDLSLRRRSACGCCDLSARWKDAVGKSGSDLTTVLLIAIAPSIEISVRGKSHVSS